MHFLYVSEAVNKFLINVLDLFKKHCFYFREGLSLNLLSADKEYDYNLWSKYWFLITCNILVCKKNNYCTVIIIIVVLNVFFFFGLNSSTAVGCFSKQFFVTPQVNQREEEKANITSKLFIPHQGNCWKYRAPMLSSDASCTSLQQIFYDLSTLLGICAPSYSHLFA